MAVNASMPLGSFLPDDAIDPALRDPAANVHGAGRFSSSLVPAHFPVDEPHGQVDLNDGHGAHSGVPNRQALRPRKSNMQYAQSNEMDANSRAKNARRMENIPTPRHEEAALNQHIAALPTNRQNHQVPSFNRNLYPGYDELGRRHGLDHLYGTQAPAQGDYYRQNTHEYSAGPSQAQMQPFPQAIYNHQPVFAGGEYPHAQYPQSHSQHPSLHASYEHALMSLSQSTEATFTVPMPPKRERTLHDLFGLDPGVEISLEGLKDPPKGQKPEYTYPTLMKVAIWSSPRKMLTLQEIYDALEKRFPYFKDCANPNSWKTSIRHSLSLIAIFQKKPRPATDPGKGSYWALDLMKGEGNKRERKRNKKPPKSRAKAAATSQGKEGGNSSMEQPSSTADDEEDLSATEEDEGIDPALIHQPASVPAGTMHAPPPDAQQQARSAESISRAANGQPNAKRARTTGRPYPQNRSHIRESSERDHDSENDSNTNSSLGRSATSTPFDEAFEGNNAGVNNIVSGMHNMNNVAAASTSAIRPIGRQLPAVQGYFPGPMPANLNDFHLAYGIGGGTGMSMVTPGGGRNAVQIHNANTNIPSQPSSAILPNIPEYRRQQTFVAPALQAPNKNVPAGTTQASRTASNSAASGVGFAAHATRAVSFSSAAAASANAGPLPFGQNHDDIEIVRVGGGLPVARRVSNARAMRRAGN